MTNNEHELAARVAALEALVGNGYAGYAEVAPDLSGRVAALEAQVVELVRTLEAVAIVADRASESTYDAGRLASEAAARRPD